MSIIKHVIRRRSHYIREIFLIKGLYFDNNKKKIGENQIFFQQVNSLQCIFLIMM